MGIINDFLSMIYPRCCEICGCTLVEGEEILCLNCEMQMPRMDIHIITEHPFARRMAAAKFVKTASMFAYVKDSSYARLIQKAKYNNRPEIDRILAKHFAQQLGMDFFNDIDYILPVPIHWWKRFRRGYNQSEYIAQGLSEVSRVKIGNHLVAMRGHTSQTRKSAEERLKNTQNVFDVINPDELEGKHVLIVDDVITTGATLLECADTLRQYVSRIKISCLSLAAARQQ